ncbi:MAG: hypothetical protein ABSC05_25610, partial [Candidatus Solibacter sp.]
DLEQCNRLVAYTLGRQLTLHCILEPPINERYEAALVSWLPEHPFLSGRHFRNAVFESIALARLIASKDPGLAQLALEYVDLNKHNYHLIYFLDQIASESDVPITCLSAVIGSAMEFRSTTTSIEIHVDGPPADDLEARVSPNSAIETEIEIISGSDREKSKTYVFRSRLGDVTSVTLGRRLSTTYVDLPVEVILAGTYDVELVAPVEVTAARITVATPTLILRHATSAADDHVLLEAERIESTAGTIVTNGVAFTLSASDGSSMVYPAAPYFRQVDALPQDPLLREKYMRLKRILVHFRSHSKGALAKYKHKIEHERVVRNKMGWAILDRLLGDQVLTLSGRLYYLQPENVDRFLGVSYDDLRKGRSSEKMLQYLRSIS